jgi:hypothetical protein
MPDSTAVRDSATAHNYRSLAEKVYCRQVVALLDQVGQSFEPEDLLTVGKLVESLPHPLRKELETSSSSAKLGPIATEVIKQEICHCLLYYLRKVQHIRHQRISLVGQAILEYERHRLDLSQETATAINQAVSPAIPLPSPTDSAKLEKYDQHLFQALQRDRPQFRKQPTGLANRSEIPLKQSTQAELVLLQRILEISDREVPPPELLWSGRDINYIRLWRLLDARQWQAANRETLICLVRAGGKPTADLDELAVDHLPLQTIDVERIPLVDLQTLDLLWSQASGGRFGFKAQLKLWQEINPTSDQKADLAEFGKRVDWRRNNSWIGYSYTHFSLGAVTGHLPTFPQAGWWCWARMEPLVQRIKQLVLMEELSQVALDLNSEDTETADLF